MKKKVLALLLSAVLCTSVSPVTGMAAGFGEEDTALESGELWEESEAETPVEGSEVPEADGELQNEEDLSSVPENTVTDPNGAESETEDNSGNSDIREETEVPVASEPTEVQDSTLESVTVNVEAINYEWVDRYHVKIKIKTDTDGICYYKWAREGEEEPVLDGLHSEETGSLGEGKYELELNWLQTADPIVIYFRIKDNNNGISSVEKFELDQSSRPLVTPTPTGTPEPRPTKKPTVTPAAEPKVTVTPAEKPKVTPTEAPGVSPTPIAKPNATPSVTPTGKPKPTQKVTPIPGGSPTPTPGSTHNPIVTKVTESVVKGLEKPLKFTPGKFYKFTVIGAGTTNKNPHEGDVKWVPLYWSTSPNPREYQKMYSWQIGTGGGIFEEGTYNLYIFFEKMVYKNYQWRSCGEEDYAVYQFSSAAVNKSELEKKLTPALSGIYNGSSGILVKWKPVSDADGYTIYRKTGNSKKWNYIATVKNGNAEKYVDDSVKNGICYTYTVRGYVSSFRSSYDKAGLKIVRLTAPALYTPSSKAAGKLTVRWKKAPFASGYQIQYAASKSFSGAKTMTETGLTKTISGLRKGGTYYVRVRAYKKVSGKVYYSAWSDGKSVKIRK